MQIDTKLSGIIQAARTTAENATLKPLDRNADLREAAEQFEAIFLNEFIKQARKAKKLTARSAMTSVRTSMNAVSGRRV